MESQSGAPYGAWSKAGLPLTIAYSLGVFDEIGFLVNEGYRRIPYGGIEHGGLLFGSCDGAAVKIESFRQIECEHAAGPGFALSANDVEKIKEQLRSSGTDPQLRGLESLGWFVSYSRRDLAASSAELGLFRSLFPKPWQVMLFVKPERFKPTRFALTLPNQSPVPPANLDLETFVLPIPGQQERESRNRRTLESVKPSLDPLSKSDESVEDAAYFEAEPPLAAKARLRKAAALEALVEVSSSPVELVPEQLLFLPQAAPATREQPVSELLGSRSKAPLVLGAISALFIAACSFWFYQAYQQPAIELHVQPGGSGVVVTWPAGETSDSNKAELRIWSGGVEQVVPLSSVEKNAGRAAVPVKGDDITIELLSRHWLQNRRGMTRLLAAAGK
jgi:hypothetical protein